MDIEKLTYSQLSSLLKMAADKGATEALTRCDVIKSIITLAEIRRAYGHKMANDARMSKYIKWFPNGKGTTSGVYCRRKEFMDYLFQNRIKEILE